MMLRMCNPTEAELQSFIHDFKGDFGVTIPVEDARQILVLYGELCEVFEKYRGESSHDELTAFLEQ
jgi:hypothetical protein